MNKTTNYNLNQWEAGDRVLRTDFNSDNAKIDAALAGKAEASVVTALQTAVTGKGNCRIEMGSYVGNGEASDIVSITTSFPPKLILVMNGILGVAVRPCRVIRFISSIARTGEITWRDDGVSWKRSSTSMDAGDFMNSANDTCYYIALG